MPDDDLTLERLDGAGAQPEGIAVTNFELLVKVVDRIDHAGWADPDTRTWITDAGIQPSLEVGPVDGDEDELARRLCGALAYTIDVIAANAAPDTVSAGQAILNYARGRVHGRLVTERTARMVELATLVAALPEDYDPDRDVMCLFRADEYELFKLMAEQPEAIIGEVEGDWYSRIVRTRAEATVWPFDTSRAGARPGSFGGVARRRVG